jgi:DNA invertase Pin-like site-specific DNA recombinase
MTSRPRHADAVTYCRVSSTDQQREGFSIPAQQKLLREYARDHTLTILQEFVDVETAKQAGRAHFTAMLAFLSTHPACKTILVEKTDRLYRNFKDYVTLEDLGVTIHFVKEHTLLAPDSRSSDKLMHNIKVAMAKNYVDNLSEEVKKGMREKAEQGHWPSVAPIGYVNNRSTHRIEPDRVRAPLLGELFRLYATGAYSLNAMVAKAQAIGLTHPRGHRRLYKSDIHRLFQNRIYYGEFVWLGTRYQGIHEPLISRATFEAVQAQLRRKPRAQHPRQRHAFMGLLTCARCGCAITAERKKGKYVYYHCTDFLGGCDNTYIREERLGDLLGDVIKPITISPEIADDIASAIRGSDVDAERARTDALRQVDQRRCAIAAKQDRAYEDFIDGRIPEAFWQRKSEQWETELQLIDAERTRLEVPQPPNGVTAEKILELAKQAEILYKSQGPAERRRLLETVLSNCHFDRGSLCVTYAKPFDLLVRGNQTCAS